MKEKIHRGVCPLSRRLGEGTPALCLLIAVLWGVLYYLTPFQVDDLAFIGSYRELNSMSDSFSLKAWWDFVCEIRVGDSARVGNILMIPSALWTPWKWLFPWLTGLMTAAMIYMAARYAFGRSLDWTSLGLVWILTAVFLPWRNFIVTNTYSLNYVYPSVLTLGLVWLIMNVRGWGWRFWVTLLLAVAAGWWHEGFAATALCGLGLVMLLRRGRMSVQWWIICLAYGITLLILVSSPLVVGRMAYESTDPGRWIHPGFAYDSLMAVTLLFSVLGFLFTRRGRRRLGGLFGEWKFPLFLTVSVCGTLLAFIFTYTPRVCFWPSLASIIALGILWRSVWLSFSVRIRSVVGIGAILVAVLHLVHVIDWQSRYYQQDKLLNEMIEASPTGTVFYDLIPTQGLPKTTLYYPSKEMWFTLFHYHCLSLSQGGRQIAVVPRSLENARPADSLRIESNLPVYSTGDAIFIDSQSVPWLKLGSDSLRYIARIPETDFKLRDGREIRFPASLFLYYFNQAGDTLLYLYPYDIEPREVTGVNLSRNNVLINSFVSFNKSPK